MKRKKDSYGNLSEFEKQEYHRIKRRESYDRHHPESTLRRQKRRICIEYRQLQLGSPNPWKIIDYHCGKNRGGTFPEKLPKWARCWRDERGRFQDVHTVTLGNTYYDFGTIDSFEDKTKLFCLFVGVNKETGESDVTDRWEWQLSLKRIQEIHERLGINGKKSPKEVRNEDYLQWAYWEKIHVFYTS